MKCGRRFSGLIDNPIERYIVNFLSPGGLTKLLTHGTRIGFSEPDFLRFAHSSRNIIENSFHIIIEIQKKNDNPEENFGQS
jgi:hypothetical protein